MVFRIEHISELPSAWRDTNPHALALVSADGELSYAELASRTRAIARALDASGCGAGTRIAYLAKNDLRFFELFFGAATIGAVLTPVNWRLSAEEVAFVLEDCGATVVVVSPEFQSSLAKIRAKLPHVRKVVVLSTGDDGFDAWRDGSADCGVPIGSPGDEVLQIYSSGTTGRPKGAVLTSENILAYVREIARTPIAPVGRDTRMLVPLPLFHVGGACWAMIALYYGGTDILPADAAPGSIIEAIRRFNPNKIGLVPAVLRTLLDDPELVKLDLSQLETVGYGGSPIATELMLRADAVFSARVVQMFGMTESCAMATFLAHDQITPDKAGRRLSVGRPTSCVQVRVVNTDGHDVECGESGEILVKSPTVMKGYWGRPEATAEAIVDGWYHSGDVGCFDADGYLYIHDRLRDMIISGGENVFSAEVENALADHADIAEVAVIGIPDNRWGEAVMAVVVVAPGRQLAPDDVIAYSRTRLAAYKCPRSIEFIEALPRNASGKILKRELRAVHWAGHERSVA